MAKVTAIGKKYGIKMKVECTEADNRLSVFFNGEKNPTLEVEFRKLLQGGCHMGCYYPKESNLLGAYIVLMNGFYNETPTIKVDGDIGQIPYEDGVIY